MNQRFSDAAMTPAQALSAGTLYWFRDWPNEAVPRFGAGVYTIWHKDGRFIYVGMSGRSITSDSKPGKSPHGLYIRLKATGGRSGDQFCVYVADRLVLLSSHLGTLRTWSQVTIRWTAMFEHTSISALATGL